MRYVRFACQLYLPSNFLNKLYCQLSFSLFVLCEYFVYKSNTARTQNCVIHESIKYIKTKRSNNSILRFLLSQHLNVINKQHMQKTNSIGLNKTLKSLERSFILSSICTEGNFSIFNRQLKMKIVQYQTTITLGNSGMVSLFDSIFISTSIYEQI